MYSMATTFMFSAFAGILAPFRRRRGPRQATRPPVSAPTTAPALDAAAYAAMRAEADRIAAPYCQHIASLRAADSDDFSEVEALLARAGLLSER